MAIQGYDSDKCVQRRRMAGLRFGVDSAPIQLSDSPLTASTTAATVYSEYGSLPEEPEEAIKAINRLQVAGAKPMELDDVYIHYGEAANSNFVPNRFLFLGESTLRNIASRANEGFAFMNSHATGGMSHPAELPFGRTFGGKFLAGADRNGSPFMSALVGIYMMKGVHPTGTHGPSTDDLHKMIKGGQVFDLSVGVTGGEQVCDICSHDLNGDKCPHVPGTKYRMTEEEIKFQIRRGVKSGYATYTYNNATPNEVSAVYDGAVPGAGLRKVFSMSSEFKGNENFLVEAKLAYGELVFSNDAIDPLFQKNDNNSNLHSKNRGKIMKFNIEAIKAKLGITTEQAEALVAHVEPVITENVIPANPLDLLNTGRYSAAAAQTSSAPATQLSSSEAEELKRLREAEANRARSEFTLRQDLAKTSAVSFANTAKSTGKVKPYLADSLCAIHTALAILPSIPNLPEELKAALSVNFSTIDAAQNVTTEQIPLVQAFERLINDTKAANFTQEQVAGAGIHLLANPTSESSSAAKLSANGQYNIVEDNDINDMVGMVGGRRKKANG